MNAPERRLNGHTQNILIGLHNPVADGHHGFQRHFGIGNGGDHVGDVGLFRRRLNTLRLRDFYGGRGLGNGILQNFGLTWAVLDILSDHNLVATTTVHGPLQRFHVRDRGIYDLGIHSVFSCLPHRFVLSRRGVNLLPPP